MCSDGLTNMVEDDDIEYIVRHSGSIEKAVDSLVEKANENGGKDNITVIWLKYRPNTYSRDPDAYIRKKRL